MTTDLALREAQAGIDFYRQATDVAGICKEIVTRSAVNIKGKKYVPYEAWSAIAVAHGTMLQAGNVERLETGFKAIAKLIRMSDGMVLSQAEGFVGDDELVWKNRSEYAKRAMAQTRAMSRCARSAFSHVVIMMNAGLSTTPAEEVPYEGFEEEHKAEHKEPEKPCESDQKATQPQLNAIHAILKKLGYTKLGDEVKKHQEVAKILGLKELKSFNDLTKKQASEVIRVLGIWTEKNQDKIEEVNEEDVPF